MPQCIQSAKVRSMQTNSVDASARLATQLYLDAEKKTPWRNRILIATEAAATAFMVHPSDFMERTRKAAVSIPRQVAIAIAMTLGSVGHIRLHARFGMDHGTIDYAVRKWEKIIVQAATEADGDCE